MNNTWADFQNQRFIALETYRKNGSGVSTPVGFVVDGDTLVVRTQAQSGKVKRIRANPVVRVAPSTGRGELLGNPFEAKATLLDDQESQRVRKLILARYGLIWRAIELSNLVVNRLKGRPADQWVSIRISR